MSVTTVAGLLLIALPLAFNGTFALLAARFEYPDIIALTQTAAAPALLGVAGIAIGVVLAVCALEFVGGHEPTGWRLAERLTPAAYVAWSLWLAATGIALLV